MSEQQFDELTRRLARPLSRRGAVRVLAGAALGGIFARFGAGKAEAQFWGGGNNILVACNNWCDALFHQNTPAFHACTSAAYNDVLNGTKNSLCLSPCGPFGTNCTSCPSGACRTCLCGTRSSYSTLTCCAGGATCLHGGLCCSPPNKVCTSSSGARTCAACCVDRDCTGSPQGPKCVNGTCGCTAVGDCPLGQACDTTAHTCGAPCGPGHTACNGAACANNVCVPCTNEPDGTACGAGGTAACCSGACVDITTNQNNCGSCGHSCNALPQAASGLVCVSGHCGCTEPDNCPFPEDTCSNNLCVPCTNFPNGTPCNSGGTCCGGSCCTAICVSGVCGTGT